MVDGFGSVKTGIGAALAETFSSADPVPGVPSAEQLELMSPLRAVDEGNAAAERGIAPRGAGRPPGAKNKSTEAWREYLLTRGPSPLAVMQDAYSRPVADLAAELGCSKLEAFRLQMVAAKEIAPYIHQRMPMAIDTGSGGLIALNIIQGTHAAKEVAKDPHVPVHFLDIKTEQNQLVIDHEHEKSDVMVFDASEKQEQNQSLNSEKAPDTVSDGFLPDGGVR